MSSWLRVQYSCPGCGLTDREIAVPARTEPETESVTAWMDRVGRAIADDHRLARPACQAQKMENLKIPFKDAATGWEAAWIGQPRPW